MSITTESSQQPSKPSNIKISFTSLFRPSFSWLPVVAMLALAFYSFAPLVGNHSVLSNAVFSLLLAICVPLGVVRLERQFASPDLTARADGEWKMMLIDSSKNCLEMAAFHDRRSRAFLTFGIIAAFVGLVFYVYFLSIREITNAESVTFRLQDDVVKFTGLMEILKGNGSIGKEYVAEIMDATKDLRVDMESYVAATRSEGVWRLLPLLRTTAGFIFIEVLAGFFFSLSKKNDSQALFWRSHKEVYDRLVFMPAILKTLKQDATIDEMERFVHFTPPVSMANEQPRLDNPMVQAIDVIRRLQREEERIEKTKR